LTFVALLLTLAAGFTVCFGRRRERMYGATTRPSTYATGTTAPTRPGLFNKIFRRGRY
jgi:hypothetical protein